MAIVKQGGTNPNSGSVMTSMGYRQYRPPLCQKCGERKPDQLYTINANGQQVCADCAGRVGEGVLRQTCDPETCACGKAEVDESDPA